MRFDDRLTTVLNQPARTRHDKAVRWRQLVDLVARAGTEGEGTALDQAMDALRADAGLVEEPVRAAAARAVAGLPLPLVLLELFAGDTLTVAAPALATARLDRRGWARLARAASPETRGFIATLDPRTAQPGEDLSSTLILNEPVTQADRAKGIVASTLADVVARIDRRKRGSLAAAPGPGPAGRDPALFRWECGPSGDIHWVEGAPRGALVGRSIAAARGSAEEGPDDSVVRAFALRSPFRDAPYVIAGSGAVSGTWRMNGVPAFDPSDGRFAGYRGVALRDRPAGASAATGKPLVPVTMADPASLRELVHEIKTPLNAIIGFAEIIDGQYLGPADSRYRQRAAHIVGQARLLLGAIDDLDFAAKAHAQAGPTTVNLGTLVADLIHDLRARARAAGAEIDSPRTVKTVEAAIAPALAERAIRSALFAVIDQAGRGERLRLTVDKVGERSRVAISRPRAFEGLSEAQLLGISTLEGDGTPGMGFSLRLARGLARMAGIALVAGEREIALLFDQP